jgi:hypothetical protein
MSIFENLKNNIQLKGIKTYASHLLPCQRLDRRILKAAQQQQPPRVDRVQATNLKQDHIMIFMTILLCPQLIGNF